MDLVQLFGKNFLPLLKYIKEKSPIEFQEQLHNIKEDGDTFFSSMISNNYYVEEEAIDFLIEEKYDFFKKIQTSNFSYTYDFYRGFYRINDSSMLKIIQYEYEKNPDIINIISSSGGLHLIFQEKHVKTLNFLFSKNIDKNSLDKNGKTIEEISLDKIELRSIYTDLKDKYFSSNEVKPISEMIDWLNKEIKKSQNNKEYDYNFPFKVLNDEIKKYTNIEQEEIISYLPLFKKLSFTNKALSILGMKLKTYKPKFIPIWDKMDRAESGDLLYHLIENNPHDSLIREAYFDANNQTNVFFVTKLSQLLNNMGSNYYSDFTYRARGSKELKIYKLQKETSKLLTVDFLTSTNPVTKKTWFETLLFNEQASFILYLKKMVKINEKTINPDDTLRILENTWLYKDENGISILEKYLLKNRYSSLSNFDIFNHKLLELDKNENILSNEQRLIILKSFLSSYMGEVDKQLTNEMIKYLVEKDDFNWDKVNIDNFDGNRVDKELIENIKKIKLHYSLNNNIENNSSKNITKMKI